MSATVLEKYTGRKLNGKSAQRIYFIKGATDEADALTALLTDAGVPSTIAGLPRINAECEAEELEAGYYLGTAVYRTPDAVYFQSPNTFSVSFDIAGQSQKITQSKATINSYAPTGATAKDFQGAINVQQDGTVDGCELIIPFLSYTVTYTFPDADITTTFVNRLAMIVGTVNNASFHGYAAGELLLTRASGQKRNDGSGNWDVVFGFAASRNCASGLRPNGAAFTIGTGADQITVTTKKGWDYLWVRYEERSRTWGSTTALHKIPVSAHVEQVYDYTDYSLLGIGT